MSIENNTNNEGRTGLLFVLDPNEDDTRVISLKLEKRGYRIKSFKSSAEMIRKLHEFSNVLVILIEYSINEGEKTGLDVIQHINKLMPNPPPFIMMSSGDEKIAVDAIKFGAMDYVPKSRGWYNHIHLRIIHTIVHKDMINEVKELRSLTDAVFENSFDSILIVDNNGNSLHCNQNMCDLIEYTSRDDFLEKIKFNNLFLNQAFANQLISEISQGHVINDRRTNVVTKFGLEIPVSFSATFMHQVNRLMFIFSDLRMKEDLIRQINELKNIASEKILMAAFKVGEMGPEVICAERESEYLNDELLMKMAIFFSVSLGQGDNIHKGLYGPLPMPETDNEEYKKFEEKYVSLIYSLNLNDKLNTDPRAKGKSFTLITINMPETLVDTFNNRKKVEETVKLILLDEKIDEVEQIKPNLLSRIKNDILSLNIEL